MKPLVVLCLFVGLILPLWSQEELVFAQVSPAPGTYEGPLRVDVRAPTGASVLYRFLETPGTTSFPWPDGLVLDALSGEGRTYGLRLTTNLPSGESVVKDYRYRVTKKVIPTATVQPEPGRYWTAVTVKAGLPEGWTVELDGARAVFPMTIDAPPGQTTNFDFTATGPQGQHLTWSYRIDRRDQELQSLELVSPRVGTWANAQSLVAVFRGVDAVLWSYGETFDPASAQEYNGPVLLEKPGVQAVTVTARSRTDGQWLSRTVRWTNGNQNLSEGWPDSGVQASGLTLPAVPGTLLSWDEGRSWEPGASSNESASATARKVLSLQVRKGDETYRYIYWLDARPPQVPTVEFVGGWNPRVSFAGSAEAAHRVTWTKADGHLVEEPGLVWGPVGSWKVPDGVVAARIRTRGVNGLEGPSVPLGFAETGWSTPTWEPWDQRGPLADPSQLPLGGRVLPRPGFWPVFSVSDRPDLPDPDANSSLLDGAFLPSFPWGSDRTLYVRFAWRDAGGLVGPGSPPYAVRVDRVPPSAPEVVTQGGLVLLKAPEGEDGGTFFWAVTTGRVSSSEMLAFQPYRAALDRESLRSAGTGTLWFHAQTQDRAGNLGPARLNVALSPGGDQDASVVQVDSNPAVGEIPVENGGVYPWPVFRLRAVSQGSDLWVGVTDSGSSVPSDWKSRVQPWTGTLSRGIARGERRTFLVYWNAKAPEGWAWESPKTLLITLDLSAPVPPVLSGTWPSAPLGAPWALSLRPGRTGDILRYTYTLDGTPPADPGAGEPWPGIRTWDAPSGSRVQVRVRIAAVSVSGLTVEAPLGSAVVIDRSPPMAITPALEPFTYRTAPLVVALPPGAERVRYSLTTDGQLPPSPTEAMGFVPASGLMLEGRPGESVLYRFFWRSYSLAGIPGPAAGPFGVLIDRTGTNLRPNQVLSDGLFPAPELVGIPVSGISSVPVTLTAAPQAGLLRFEVEEGLAEPRPVTAESALWTGPLVLDGGPGVDRAFAVSVRVFSAQGQPLSSEASWAVRIDRSVPSAPAFDLIADTRRPEAVLKTRTDANPEETLFYRWSWLTFPDGSGSGEWAALSRTEAVFSAPGGAVTRLRLEAFLRDEAGNSGPPVERTLLIDQNAVYLAPSGTGDGSRDHPVGTVSDAVGQARREGKSIILAGAGSYLVQETLNLGGLQVYGGLAAPGWDTSEPTRSLWTAGPGFRGTTFLESENQDWSTQNLDLMSQVPLTKVVAVKGATASVRNANWTWSGATTGWSQEGGSVSWTNVGASYTAENQGGFVEWSSVEASVRGLRLAAIRNQGAVLLALSQTVALFQNLVLVSKDARGYDGVISASQSRITVDQARIQAGDGADRATAFLLKNTEATLWNTEVSLYGAASNTGYQASGGRLELQKGTLSIIKGVEYNQGLVLDGTQTVLRSFHLKIDSASYQGGLSVDGGTLAMAASEVVLAGGGQRVWGAQFLSEVLVTLEDVDWTLTVKTPGDLWKKVKPWAAASSTQGVRTSGW